MKNIINYLYIFVVLLASEFIFSDELEEVIVVADYRQTDLSKEDSSVFILDEDDICLLYTSPSPRDREKSRMPSSA